MEGREGGKDGGEGKEGGQIGSCGWRLGVISS